jgi:hypothetical protein
MFDNIVYDIVIHNMVLGWAVSDENMAIAKQYAIDNDLDFDFEVRMKWNVKHQHRLHAFLELGGCL